MFLIFDKKAFKTVLNIKFKIDKTKKRILFYDFIDLLTFLIWRDKIYLNNIYWISVKRRNYSYLITRYWIDWKNISNIDINSFIQIRFKQLFKIIPYKLIQQIAVRWKKVWWNIAVWEDLNISNYKDKFILIQRRFITQHLPQINFMCYMLNSEKIFKEKYLKQEFNKSEFYKKIYKFERKEKKIYTTNVIQKKWSKTYQYTHLKNCPKLKVELNLD